MTITQEVLEAMKQRKPVQYFYRDAWFDFDYESPNCGWHIFMNCEWRVKPEKVKGWQWIIRRKSGLYNITTRKYATKEMAQKKYEFHTVIEPYLPSEEEILPRAKEIEV